MKIYIYRETAHLIVIYITLLSHFLGGPPLLFAISLTLEVCCVYDQTAHSAASQAVCWLFWSEEVVTWTMAGSDDVLCFTDGRSVLTALLYVLV